MLHKKTFIFKLLASLLCLLLTLPTTSVTALDLFPGTDSVDDSYSALSEVLDTYFESRTKINDTVIIEMLSGITFEGMMEDELLRSNTLINSNIIAVENSYYLEYYDFYEYYGVVYATETIEYIKFDSSYSDIISHQITFTYDDGCVIIASSNYRESFISFDSCAYVPATTTNSAYTINSNTDDESNDIVLTCNQANNLVQIALQEEGYIEKRECKQLDDKYALPRTSTYDNHTKYGQWHSSCAAWCVMFVAWCADQAGISTKIIPKTKWGNVGDFNTLLQANGGTYHPVKDSTGTYYVPQTGDIFFMQTSDGKHTGIVVSTENVSENTLVWVVDGNWGDKVSYRSHNITDPLFVGYITPNYVTDENKHHYVCADHDSTYTRTHCNYCGKEGTSVNMQTTHSNIAIHSCTLCDYTFTGSVTLEYDTAEHWYECSICNETWLPMDHVWVLTNGIYSCRICKSPQYITINKIKIPICLMES